MMKFITICTLLYASYPYQFAVCSGVRLKKSYIKTSVQQGRHITAEKSVDGKNYTLGARSCDRCTTDETCTNNVCERKQQFQFQGAVLSKLPIIILEIGFLIWVAQAYTATSVYAVHLAGFISMSFLFLGDIRLISRWFSAMTRSSATH